MKILVINTKFLGDLIISTPGIRSLRKTFPSAEIVLLVRQNFENLFKNNPHVNRIITFDPKVKGKSNIKNILEGIRFIKNIRKEKFNSVIALHPGDRIAFWAFLSGAKKRVAPRKQSFSFLFNIKVDVEEDTIGYLDYYNKLFSAFGVQIDSNKTEIFVSSEDEIWAKSFWVNNKVAKNELVIGIHPSASEPSKIWKIKNFIQLIHKVTSNNNIKIIVFEGPQDQAICDELKQQLSDNPKVLFVKTDLLKVTSLIKNCSLFICNDTGTRHIAAALETPTIALIPKENKKCWDFYSDHQKHYTIYGKRNMIETNSGLQTFLDGITVEAVYQRIITILGL